MAHILNTNNEISGIFPIISNKTNLLLENNNISSFKDLDDSASSSTSTTFNNEKIILINSICDHKQNNYKVDKKIFSLHDNSKLYINNYELGDYIISSKNENINNSFINFPNAKTDITSITNIDTIGGNYTNGINGFNFPYKTIKLIPYKKTDCIMLNIADINRDLAISSINYSELTWHKHLANDSNRFFYYGKNINDIIFDYPISTFEVLLDCVSGETILNNILSYIPKDLHQANLNIKIIPYNGFTEASIIPRINLDGFYNGIINITSDTSQLCSYFYLNASNCDYININNISNHFRRSYLAKDSLFIFKNIKFINIINSYISHKYDNSIKNNYIDNFNHSSTLTYKEVFFKENINKTDLGNLIYIDNCKLVITNTTIGNSSISIDPYNDSLVTFIAKNNSTFISKNNTFYFNSISELNKRRIIFYSFNNSIIISSNDEIKTENIITGLNLASYDYYNYPVNQSIIYGYASVGSIFNHNHQEHMLLSSQTYQRNNIAGDLPIGSIYSIDHKAISENYFPNNNGNQYNSQSDILSIGSIMTNDSSICSCMTYGISYPASTTFSEYTMLIISGNFDPTIINAYDILYPLSTYDNRLYGKFSENLFYFQKYYSMLGTGEFLAPTESILLSDAAKTEGKLESLLPKPTSNIKINSYIYKNFIPASKINDEQMLTKYSMFSYIKKENFITDGLIRK